jgi:hypothetical protein
MLTNKTLYISILFLALYTLIYFLFGERIPIGHGYGWDGIIYAAYVQNFWSFISHTHDIYHVNRILPSFVIYLCLKLLHLNMDSPAVIVSSFIILNSLAFLFTAYLWFKICQYKNLNVMTYWLGFISLFVNFMYLKHNFYDPVLTDSTALFLGMLSLYFYIQKKYFLLALSIFPAFFSWPISLILISPLLLYTSPAKMLQPINEKEQRWSFIFSLIFITTCIYLTYIVGNTKIISNSINISYPLLPFSIIIAAMFIYVVLLHSRLFDTLNYLYQLNFRNLLYLITTCLLCAILYRWLLHHVPHYDSLRSVFTMKDLITISILGAIARPGLFFISHFAFWGPIVVLIIFKLKAIVQQSTKESYGLMLFVIITTFLALNSQTRQLAFNYPFIVYLLCSVMNNTPLTKQSLFYFLSASLIISKFYYVIGLTPYTDPLAVLVFPLQRFMINSGTYMSWTGYFINVGLFIFAIVVVYLVLSFPHRKVLKNTENYQAGF